MPRRRPIRRPTRFVTVLAVLLLGVIGVGVVAPVGAWLHSHSVVASDWTAFEGSTGGLHLNRPVVGMADGPSS